MDFLYWWKSIRLTFSPFNSISNTLPSLVMAMWFHSPTGFIAFFVGLSVAFGIASVLVVTVVQKSSEIGVLRAMGITRGEILRVFILQGALLGLGDAIVGSGLGMLALATVTGLVAAFAPALRATRLDPVVAING